MLLLLRKCRAVPARAFALRSSARWAAEVPLLQLQVRFVSDTNETLQKRAATLEAQQTSSVQALQSELREIHRRKVKQYEALKEAMKKTKTEDEILMRRGSLLSSNIFLVKSKFHGRAVKDRNLAKPLVVEVTEFVDFEMKPAKLEIHPDLYATADAELNAIFKKIRRIERGWKKIEKRMVEVRWELRKVKQLNEKLDSGHSIAEIEGSMQKSFGESIELKNKPKEARKSNVPFRRFSGAQEGSQIWVGRNRTENDHLTMRVASAGDAWMHAKGCAGSHVLIRMFGPEKIPDEETLAMAANLAALHSKQKMDSKVMITVADPKDIRKPPQAPKGAVILMKEKRSLVGFPEKAAQYKEI